jgi:hypothetical protein
MSLPYAGSSSNAAVLVLSLLALKPFQIFHPFVHFCLVIEHGYDHLSSRFLLQKVVHERVVARREHPDASVKCAIQKKQVGELRVLFNKSTEAPNWLLYRSRKLMPTISVGEYSLLPRKANLLKRRKCRSALLYSAASNVCTRSQERPAPRSGHACTARSYDHPRLLV